MTIPRALLLLAFAFLVAWMFPGGPRPAPGPNLSSSEALMDAGRELPSVATEDPASSLLAETAPPAS